MSEAPEQRPLGSLGLGEPLKRKRGRPRKHPLPMPPAPPLEVAQEDLLDMVRTLVTQQAKVLEQMTAAQTATTDLMKTWMQLFVPAAQPVKSTSADERALLAEERALAEWEPLDAYLDPKEVLRSLM